MPKRFAMFPVHVSRVLRLPGKSEARSYEVLHLTHKIIFQMQPLWGNQRPDLLTSLMNMSLVLRLPQENASLQILLKRPTPANTLETAAKSSRVALTRCTIPRTCHAKRHLNVQKWSEHVVLLTFWLGNALGATMAFTFSTSQLLKLLGLRCFVRFDFEMCFAPQLRAPFRHRNF